MSAGALAAELSPDAVSAAALPLRIVDSTVQAALQFAAGKAVATGLVSARASALTKGVLASMLVSKLRTTVLLFLALTVLGAGIGLRTYRALAADQGVASVDERPNRVFDEDAKRVADADKKSDKEKLQGSWVPVAAVTGGIERSEQEIKDKNFVMVFTGDKVTIPAKDVTKQEVTYKLDPSQKPKHIDFLMPEDKLAKGIYLLEGDTLTVCVSEKENDERPKEFESKQGSNVVLMKLKRK